MTRRPVAAVVALLLWLLLIPLWAAWTVLLAVAWIAAKQKRQRARIVDAYVRFPLPHRIAARLPGRPRPVRYAAAHAPRRRMSSGERERMARQLLVVDGPWCQVCGDGLDLAAHHHDPLAPEVHHVIPFSQGGPCHITNAVLSHRRCNQRVGARVLPHLVDHVNARNHQFARAA